MIKPDFPAFPHVETQESDKIYHGLTVRQEFAARIMAGFAALPEADWPNDVPRNATVRGKTLALAGIAVAWADALIERLNARPPEQPELC